MLHLGLTGGIGSGKSTVASLFRELGAHTLDADAIARELTGPGGAACRAVADAFGPEALRADGAVDRPRLAARVFGNPEARGILERILHPRILHRRRELLEGIREARGEGAVVVTEAALIFEAGTVEEFDRVILVTAPLEVRRRRSLEAGWAPEEFEGRVASQWPDGRKAPLADFVVDNGGDLEGTRRQVEAIWREISRRGAKAP